MIPAKAGIQGVIAEPGFSSLWLDPRLRGGDGIKSGGDGLEREGDGMERASTVMAQASIVRSIKSLTFYPLYMYIFLYIIKDMPWFLPRS